MAVNYYIPIGSLATTLLKGVRVFRRPAAWSILAVGQDLPGRVRAPGGAAGCRKRAKSESKVRLDVQGLHERFHSPE